MNGAQRPTKQATIPRQPGRNPWYTMGGTSASAERHGGGSKMGMKNMQRLLFCIGTMLMTLPLTGCFVEVLTTTAIQGELPVSIVPVSELTLG